MHVPAKNGGEAPAQRMPEQQSASVAQFWLAA